MQGVTLNWAGGEHEFTLRLGELRRMQEVCNAGPEQILLRLQHSHYLVDDLIEPIRLGLIGSEEMTNSEAGPFVIKMIEQHPLIQFKFTAQTILTHAILGPPDDQPKKQKGETQPPTENGSSANSTEPEA